MKDQNKQITQWFNPDVPVIGRWMECPECKTVICASNKEHAVLCSEPPAVQKVCRTTQFGPCKYGDWMMMMRGQLRERGYMTYIGRNDKLEAALFEC